MGRAGPRDAGRFLLARFCATLAWQMQAVAVGWHVYALTGDPLALGLVGLSEFLPFVLLVLVGGHAADHVDRRAVASRAYGIVVLCALTLLTLALEDVRRAWPIYAAVGAFGAARAFWAPAMQALLPGLVARDRFPGAVALNSMLFQVATAAGPVLGGVLYLFGPPVVFGACALLFASALLLIRMIRADTRPPAPPATGSARRFIQGLQFVRRSPLVLGVISLDLFAVLLGGAVALLPIYARDLLHTGPVGLGLLRAAPGVGAGLAALWLAMRPLRDHAGRALLGGVAVFGACMIAFGLSRSMPLSLLALLLSGSGDMVGMYVRGILVPLATPDALRGRVSAVSSMFVGASNELGEFESGLTAKWLGTVPSVVVGGMLTLAVAGAWAWRFPALRRLRHLR
ncbi:MAG: MFS transporter [Gammaproteobacteria bacterium]|nr:MFS transporter [Gammaproteobacteria bacterium]